MIILEDKAGCNVLVRTGFYVEDVIVQILPFVVIEFKCIRDISRRYWIGLKRAASGKNTIMEICPGAVGSR